MKVAVQASFKSTQVWLLAQRVNFHQLHTTGEKCLHLAPHPGPSDMQTVNLAQARDIL